MLACRNLTKAFTTPVLTDVSLDLRPGDLVSLMGRSGSGKSTLLHCLAGIEPVDSGTVTIEGTELAGLSKRELSAFRLRRVGLVFQFGQLVHELTAAENVALPLMLGGQSKRDALGQAMDWLRKLGVDERAHAFPKQLSGGEGQRVAVARAFITKPAVILADEPTGALDTENGEMVLSLLVQAAREHQVALLLATHDEALASRTDRVLRLVDGKVSGQTAGWNS